MRDSVDALVLRALIDRLPMGVVMVNGQLSILLSNPIARGRLAAEDGIRVKNDKLVAARSRESVLLRRLVAEACRVKEGSHEPYELAISRAEGRCPLAVTIVPLSTANGGPGLAAIFLNDPEVARVPSAQVLHGLYGMTAAEIRVTSLLLQGMRVSAIADCLGITTNTIRTHLKRVFAKTEARSQGDLLRILFTGVGPLRPGAER